MEEEHSKKYDAFMNLALIGDSGVGKSCLFLLYADHSFTDNSKTTCGLDFKIVYVELGGKKVKQIIWDTAAFYRCAHGIFVVYDATQRETLQSAHSWIERARTNGSPDVSLMLVATKCDLVETEIIIDEGRTLADDLKVPFLAVSSKTRMNVDKMFDSMTRDILPKVDPDLKLVPDEPGCTIDLTESPGRDRRSCCDGGAAKTPSAEEAKPNMPGLKLLLIGDYGVGKTSLMVRFIENTFSDLISIHSDSMTKRISLHRFEVELQLQDLSDTIGIMQQLCLMETLGLMRVARTLPQQFYRGADGALLVFDVTNRDSFEHLVHWQAELDRISLSDVFTMIVGNKCDKASRRVVTTAEAEIFAAENGAAYLETSAGDGVNVNDVFRKVGSFVLGIEDMTIVDPIMVRRLINKHTDEVLKTEMMTTAIPHGTGVVDHMHALTPFQLVSFAFLQSITDNETHYVARLKEKLLEVEKLYLEEDDIPVELQQALKNLAVRISWKFYTCGDERNPDMELFVHIFFQNLRRFHAESEDGVQNAAEETLRSVFGHDPEEFHMEPPKEPWHKYFHRIDNEPELWPKNEAEAPNYFVLLSDVYRHLNTVRGHTSDISEEAMDKSKHSAPLPPGRAAILRETSSPPPPVRSDMPDVRKESLGRDDAHVSLSNLAALHAITPFQVYVLLASLIKQIRIAQMKADMEAGNFVRFLSRKHRGLSDWWSSSKGFLSKAWGVVRHPASSMGLLLLNLSDVFFGFSKVVDFEFAYLEATRSLIALLDKRTYGTGLGAYGHEAALYNYFHEAKMDDLLHADATTRSLLPLWTEVQCLHAIRSILTLKAFVFVSGRQNTGKTTVSRNAFGMPVVPGTRNTRDIYLGSFMGSERVIACDLPAWDDNSPIRRTLHSLLLGCAILGIFCIRATDIQAKHALEDLLVFTNRQCSIVLFATRADEVVSDEYSSTDSEDEEEEYMADARGQLKRLREELQKRVSIPVWYAACNPKQAIPSALLTPIDATSEALAGGVTLQPADFEDKDFILLPVGVLKLTIAMLLSRDVDFDCSDRKITEFVVQKLTELWGETKKLRRQRLWKKYGDSYSNTYQDIFFDD